MRERVVRVALAAIALSSTVVGLWAVLAPRSFYDSFPGGGRAWVAADGPYNEHLVRDVGGLNLALAVVGGVAAVRLLTVLVRTAAAGWLLYGVPHLLYHAGNLEPYETADKVANVVSLGLGVVLAALVLVLTLRPNGQEGVVAGQNP